MTESVEAIVAEMLERLETLESMYATEVRRFADRLQSAHDAEVARFRWLAEQHASVGPSWHVRQPCNEVAQIDLRAAIDRAMEGEDGKAYWPTTPTNGEADWTGYDG